MHVHVDGPPRTVAGLKGGAAAGIGVSQTTNKVIGQTERSAPSVQAVGAVASSDVPPKLFFFFIGKKETVGNKNKGKLGKRRGHSAPAGTHWPSRSPVLSSLIMLSCQLM